MLHNPVARSEARSHELAEAAVSGCEVIVHVLDPELAAEAPLDALDVATRGVYNLAVSAAQTARFVLIGSLSFFERCPPEWNVTELWQPRQLALRTSSVDRTGRSLRVTFNYRYAPAYTQLRHLVMHGAVGRPLAVDFSWLLDTSHGADYFRRWHCEKQTAGGLLIHKATHHFDLVNWWIDSHPKQVFALGDLSFYGKDNAEARSEHYSYKRYTSEAKAKNDPFALFLDEKEVFRGLYLEAEAETSYLRDRNVFGEPVTIEDTMAVTARYRNGVQWSYCLIAYSPWEGLRVAITGTKGRVELDVMENANYLLGDTAASASTMVFKQTTLRTFPMFGQPYLVEIPPIAGGGGGFPMPSSPIPGGGGFPMPSSPMPGGRGFPMPSSPMPIAVSQCQCPMPIASTS